MYVGDKKRIDVSSSRFKDFIEYGNLYVDKTAFIEHVLQDASKALLFARPRRMGKSLNMDTLSVFLDSQKDAAKLFSGLYIESSPVFGQINKNPVVYLDFVSIDSSDLLGAQRSFRAQIIEVIDKFFKPEDLKGNLKKYIEDPLDYSPNILGLLLKAIAERCGAEPYLLIDEYDKVIMDTLGHREGGEIKNFIVAALQSALKGQTYFKKAVLTGVTRTTKENLFSTINNIETYDIFTPSVYDTDFSLTEDEMLELVGEDQIAGVRKWYNNMRVGDALLYNIYSVMNYLSDPKAGLKGYWSMSGGGSLLSKLLAAPLRAEVIGKMIDDERFKHGTKLDHQLNMEHIKNTKRCSDVSFYTLAVQAGYLTFEPVGFDVYKVFIPNMEARQVWSRLILDRQYRGIDSDLPSIFDEIANVEAFGKRLTKFVNMVLSYNDIKAREEWVYHVFFLGLVYSLGYECKSNLEAGLGRFDIMMKSPGFCAVIEFKVSDLETDKAMQKEVEKALKQIDDKAYMYELRDSPLPCYKIGIARHGKKCLAKAVLHISS